MIAVNDLIIFLHRRRNVIYVLDFLFDSNGVLIFQCGTGTRRAAKTAGHGRARTDNQHVAAEARNGICHTLRHAHADGHHRDNSADADDDAEHRQERAQLIGKKRIDRDAHAFRE